MLEEDRAKGTIILVSRWTTQSALHFTPWQTCSFRHEFGCSGKHSSNAAITHEDYSLAFIVHNQVLIYTAE